MNTYDYIILGAGASGLVLAYKMSQDSFFDDKSILLIDKEKKNTNDRTWCFWEDNSGIWEHILTKSWNEIIFKSDAVEINSSILPYQYKMIKSSDLYLKIWNRLAEKSNFTFLEDAVIELQQKKDFAEVKTTQKTFISKNIFKSILFDNNYKNQQKYPVLQQHFLGYFIKVNQPIFDDSVATFMDFSIPQKGNTRFMYVLPYSKTEALFEYTLFSKELLSREEYRAAIEKYLKNKGIFKYEIVEVEQGSIPMTCYPFWKENRKNILNIGTAGGWTKASTGFTFKNIHKNTTKLISHLKFNKSLNSFTRKTRFWFYDLLLLDILDEKNHSGSSIFTSMFATISPQKILKFLDEETTLWEELYIFSKMNKSLFIKALFKRLNL